MSKRILFIASRLFFGALALAAVGAQLSVQIRNQQSLVTFFSYFTILSNLFAAVVLIFGAVTLLRGAAPTAITDSIRGGCVVCMTLVGIVFSLLLRNQNLGAILPWVNLVTHYLMPMVVLLDWLVAPPKYSLPPMSVVYWMTFPLLYLAYSMVRGKFVGFYPYPFLNPAKVGGYGGVALYCLSITAGFVLVGWVLLRIGNKRSMKT